MKLFATLLEANFKVELLKLQQQLIDQLPNNAEVELTSDSNNGMYATVNYKDRTWGLKPSSIHDKVFLLGNNETMWLGPFTLGSMIDAIKSDMSETVYRCLIADNNWNRARGNRLSL